jgi:hypothetical protein
VLEGTHLTRKTDVAFALAEHVDIIGHRRRRWHIPLVSAEWETRSDEQPTKASPGRSMIDYLPGDEPWVLESYEAYLRLLELHRDYYWVVDRFHVSTMSHQRLAGREINLGWVDQRLAALNAVMVHLRREPATFARAREHRLTYSENPHRYDDLARFVHEQEVMAELVAASAMPTLTVDVSDDDVDRIADEILAWVKAVGAWWRPVDAPSPAR